MNRKVHPLTDEGRGALEGELYRKRDASLQDEDTLLSGGFDIEGENERSSGRMRRLSPRGSSDGKYKSNSMESSASGDDKGAPPAGFLRVPASTIGFHLLVLIGTYVFVHYTTKHDTTVVDVESERDRETKKAILSISVCVATTSGFAVRSSEALARFRSFTFAKTTSLNPRSSLRAMLCRQRQRRHSRCVRNKMPKRGRY